MATVHVPLTHGKVALIDECDMPRVQGYRWRALHITKGTGHLFYAVTDLPRSQGVHGETLYLHCLIANSGPGQKVDHINGDGLDCRRENLRMATHTQNQANRGKTSRNTSGYKGVNWHKPRGKWCAKIQQGGIYYHLGLYTDVVAAARAYDAKARELFGEYAHVNFPTGD